MSADQLLDQIVALCHQWAALTGESIVIDVRSSLSDPHADDHRSA